VSKASLDVEQVLAPALPVDLVRRLKQKLNFSEAGSDALGAWFLGPKAENELLLLELLADAVKGHTHSRLRDYPEDPVWLTPERKQSPAYVAAVAKLRAELGTMLGELGDSVPFYSYRYQGHMLWDVTLPSVVGYVAALLYNQNNVAAEASPVTTWLEMLVGDDLCRMLGYYVPERGDNGEYENPDPSKTVAWGHITCGGTVANCESVWAARNAKYLGIGAAAALRAEVGLAAARAIRVKLHGQDGQPLERALLELDEWQLLNLDVDVVLKLAERMTSQFEIPPATVGEILGRYSIQHLGLAAFLRDFAPTMKDPVILIPATGHYSWPKAASLVGLGKSSTRRVAVDKDARLDIAALRASLQTCLETRTPLLMAVSVLGSTEESAVDPLREILGLRREFRGKGLDFWVHVDGAWGGYFASMVRAPRNDARVKSVSKQAPADRQDANVLLYGPEIAMSAYVEEQYLALQHADSITVDPHKAGYAPYPAGGLCYRDGAMRHLVAFTAPVVYHGGVDPTVGVYGIEGSKPGAAAAGVYLSHRLIRPDESGYGRILGRCMWNSKRLYCELVAMAQPGDRFRVVALQRLPSERPEPAPESAIQEELNFIREQVLPKSNDELVELLKDPERLAWFRSLGSDQLIVSYAFNFVSADGRLNQDVALTNRLNNEIFSRLSLARRDVVKKPPLLITASQLDVPSYGGLVLDLKRRLGVVDTDASPLDFLISTTMDPWLTDTAEGNMVPRLIQTLRTEVAAIIDELWPIPAPGKSKS
jgi:glutamate/tyrosine decarboxylase-like PLP-dependent enzyme